MWVLVIIVLLLLPLVLSIIALVVSLNIQKKLERRIQAIEQQLFVLHTSQVGLRQQDEQTRPQTATTVINLIDRKEEGTKEGGSRDEGIERPLTSLTPQHDENEQPLPLAVTSVTVSAKTPPIPAQRVQDSDSADNLHTGSVDLPEGVEAIEGAGSEAIPPHFPNTPPPSTQLPNQPVPVSWSRTAALEPDEQSVSVVTSVWHSFLHWFKGGNAIVRVGIIVLLVGVVLLLRLATDLFTIPIEARLGLVAAGGVALTLVGLRLREKRRSYAISIQGAGLAIVYFTLFAAYRLYQVLPSELTFALLAILAVISAGLSLLQNALPLALMAFGGAFLAPLLASSGSNNVIGLFSYYLMLNAALAWMAHYRTWKVLNGLGALMTFGVAGFWGLSSQYDESLRWQLEGLLLAHLALYLFIVVRYSQQLTAIDNASNESASTATERKSPIASVDSALLFGVPLMGFALQAGLMHAMPYALALSSGVLSAIYLGLGYYLFYNNKQLQLLTEGVLALGVGFMALVMPLALNASWTSVGWSIQGAALVWLGIRQQRVWSVRFGLLLQAISTFSLIWLWFDHQSLVMPLSIYVACLLISAFLLREPEGQPHPDNNKFAVYSTPSFLVLVWSYMASQELVAQWVRQLVGRSYWITDAPQLQFSLYSLAFVALTALVFSRVKWSALLGLWRLIFALLTAHSVMLWLNYANSWLIAEHIMIAQAVFIVAYALFGWLLLRRLKQYQLASRIDQSLYVIGLCVQSSLLLVIHWQAQPELAVILLPLVIVGLLLRGLPESQILNQAQVLKDLSLGILLALGLWSLWANWLFSGSLLNLPYVPLVNGLDICLIAAALVSYKLLDDVPATLKTVVSVGIAIAAFWSVTGIIIRTLHEWLATPLWPQGAWQVDVVQTCLTIVWTLFALLLTGFASRLARRALWLAGIALLAIVVLKLLLVDLSNVGTVARIVSFIGAGLIMLLIGYIAPLPPSQSKGGVQEGENKPTNEQSNNQHSEQQQSNEQNNEI